MNKWIRAIIGLWVFYVLFNVFFVVTLERSARADVISANLDHFGTGTDPTRAFPR